MTIIGENSFDNKLRREIVMNRRNSVGRIIFVMFLRSFFTVVVLLLVALGSYSITMKYYEVTADESQELDMLDIVGDVTADEISRNIIYSYNQETSEIEGIVIEILNMNTNNLDFITIPANTQFTISSEVYKRMCAAGADAPQIMRMSALNSYFSDNTSYEYGILLLEDYLGIDIGYYTAVESSVFNDWFTKETDTGLYRPSDSLINEAKLSAGDMSGFIKKQYESLISDLKVKSKLKYADTYAAVNPSYIYCHMISGTVDGNNYLIEVRKAKQQYDTILASAAYTTEQVNDVSIPSAGKNIKVLNGSGTEGIATATKAMLEEDGMKVVRIADNPQVIENTIIYVAKEGMGKDLKHYFKNAKIETDQLDEGVDILIIVGSADSGIVNNQ